MFLIMRNAIFCLLFLGAFFASCNYRYVYHPVEEHSDPGVSKMYTHGIPSLYKQVDSLDLFADLTSNGQYNYSFTVGLVNNGQESIIFQPEDVKAWAYNANNQKIPLRVFTAKEYIRRRNTNNAILVTAVVVATVATAVAINEAQSPPTRNGELFNRGCDNDFWWWMAVSAPPVVINSPSDNPPRRPDNLLRTHTLLPGESLQGVIKVRSREPLLKRIEVEVPLNGTKSVFAFGARERLR